MMTTSSSSCIIKPGTGIEILRFVPPAQTDIEPPTQKSGDKGAEQAQAGENSPGPGQRTAGQGTEDVVEDAREQARQILLKANQLAGDILREAGTQAEQLKKTAIEEGCKEGFEAGYKSGTEQAAMEQADFFRRQEEEFRKDMEQALSSIDQAKEKSLRNYLEELKDCSVAIAEKVIHISLRSSGEVIKRMLVAETEKLRKTAWVKIYMEKTDYDMMAEADADVVSELAKLSDNIKFVVMDKESSGNCIIEMPDEIVDISVDTQMDNIREILGNIRF
ncbi:FliH/SctL family protein [Enterocloster aldenensis]|uniref:FliH/SctL family protein n=1 Tax=Enterocloster aldenensis TaxID=358742 RepID=UPI000E484E72|nr:flagellar biosynthesis/type III secretory pathway protein [Enterocloster aldenensis]